MLRGLAGCQVDMLIATPGRLMDRLKDDVLNLRRVTYLVRT